LGHVDTNEILGEFAISLADRVQGTIFAVPSWSARHFEDPWEFVLENNIKGVNRLDVSNILDNIVVLWWLEVISPAGEASYMKILEQINFTLIVALSASRFQATP
jgi:hypothetical protein